MSLNRTQSALAAWTLAFLVAPAALGQGLQDAQPFTPADMSTYGGGYRPSEGFFFSFDVLDWWIKSPDTALIGDATTRQVVIIVPQDILPPWKTIESTSTDTGTLSTEAVAGQRYEFGHIEEHRGWLFSGFTLGDQTQTIYASDASVVFQDAPFGSPPRQNLEGYIDTLLTYSDDLPVKFDYLEAHNQIAIWGVELNYLYRRHPNHYGGIIELFFGARYLEFEESFNVDALGGTLADSFWNTEAENHLVGPQIGARWFRKRGRWTCSAEGRAFAGYNSQNVFLDGQLGSELWDGDPLLLPAVGEITNMRPRLVQHTRHFREWSPGGEVRVDFKYQLTRAISAGVGWTGFWIDGIARPSGMIDYAIEQNRTMGITGQNRQDVFMHGLNIRLELNRP